MMWLLLALGLGYFYLQAKKGPPGPLGIVPELSPGYIEPAQVVHPPFVAQPTYSGEGGPGHPVSLPFPGHRVFDVGIHNLIKAYGGFIPTSAGGFLVSDIVVDSQGKVNLDYLMSVGSDVGVLYFNGVPVQLKLFTENRSPDPSFSKSAPIIGLNIMGHPLFGEWFMGFEVHGRFPSSEFFPMNPNAHKWTTPFGEFKTGTSINVARELSNYIPRGTPLQSVYRGRFGCLAIYNTRFIGLTSKGSYHLWEEGERTYFYPDGTQAPNLREWRRAWVTVRNPHPEHSSLQEQLRYQQTFLGAQFPGQVRPGR